MKPTVIHLIDSYHEGGSERQAVALARHQHASGMFQRVQVVALKNEGVLRQELEPFGLASDVEFPLTSFYNANFVKQLQRAARYFRRERASVVHTHDFYTNIFGMFASTLARVLARIASRRETGGIRTANQRRLERFAYSFAHHIVANAEAVRREVINEGTPATKVSTIYNGLDLTRVAVNHHDVNEQNENFDSPDTKHDERAATLARLGLNQSNLLVTIVANMRLSVKNHPMFLRMARRVACEIPEARFVLAGDGELMPELKQLATDYNLNDKAVFAGSCRDVAALLCASSVGVLSSRGEGFSNAILEYMAAQLPVVATDVGGVREAFTDGEAGYIVASEDDEAMAKRIITLLKDEHLRAQMGARGRAIVEANFSAEAQVARTAELYTRLLARRASTANESAIETRKATL